jgi:flagellar hook-associated protein 1 FlgK
MLRSQRESVSGVSLDEEMTDLVKYQRAYQASARLISTVDAMLDEVLNLKR